MNKNTKNDRLLVPLREAADLLAMSRQTLMDHVKKGELVCIRMAKNSVFFRPSDLDRFIDSKIDKPDYFLPYR